MISVLSAVAEIERENILVQTMEGRRQKAREGKWNGGFAPYGYKLVDGTCRLPRKRLRSSASSMTSTSTPPWAPPESPTGSTSTDTARSAVTTTSGKPSRVPSSSACLTIQCTAASWRTDADITRRSPAPATSTHIVKQKDYALYDGIHEPIISEGIGSSRRSSASRPTSVSSRHTALTTSTSCPGCSSAPSAAAACTAT